MKRNGFTVVEMVFLIPLTTLAIGVLLPALGAARRTARQMQNSTQVRGIHAGCVLYAQGNNEGYPGLKQDGSIKDATVAFRYKELLDGNFFTPEFAISPGDVKVKKQWRQGKFTSANYSFDMLDIDQQGTRAGEWRATTNSQAFVLGDRNVGANAKDKAQSIWSQPGEWRGSVGFNDNHVNFESTHIIDDTKYLFKQFKNDNLFDAASADDGYLIYEGK